METLRTTPSGRAWRIVDAEIAESIIDARDDLIRSLPEESFRTLTLALERAVKRTTFQLRAPGRQIVQNQTELQCRVTVKGRDYPHLIPEQFYWRFHFESRAAAARRFRRGQSDYAPEHIAVVRIDLPIPRQHVAQLLDVATRVESDIKQLPNTQANDAVGDAIAEEGHYELIRTLPKSSWLAVKADAHRARAGTVMSFPNRVQRFPGNV